jgi:hypothetical protein
MKSNSLSLLGFAGLFLVASPAYGNPNPWTDCGIGALIFSKSGAAAKPLAAISNIIWDLGSTGSTSSSSSPDTCAGADVSAAMFIQENLNVIEEQVAIGSGDHLAAVLDIYGCNTDIQSVISTELRKSFQSTTATPAYWTANQAEKAEAIWKQLSTHVSSHTDECTA